MNDLVKRARDYARNLGGPPEDYLVWQLANEIERLQMALDQGRINDQVLLDEAIAAVTEIKDARIKHLKEENERMRTALEKVVKFARANGIQDWKMTKIAKRALEE